MDSQLTAFLEANQAYSTSGSHVAPRTPQPARHVVIVTCMDARLDLFRALGLRVGDAHILRNAGGRVSDDVIRSLVVSTHLLHTREIGVIHHTDCGLAGLTNEQVAQSTGVDGIDFLPFADLDESVENDVRRVQGSSILPAETIVWGGVYEVDTGDVRVISEPRPVGQTA